MPARPLDGRYWGQSGRGTDRPKSTLMTRLCHSMTKFAALHGSVIGGNGVVGFGSRPEEGEP